MTKKVLHLFLWKLRPSATYTVYSIHCLSFMLLVVIHDICSNLKWLFTTWITFGQNEINMSRISTWYKQPIREWSTHPDITHGQTGKYFTTTWRSLINETDANTKIRRNTSECWDWAVSHHFFHWFSNSSPTCGSDVFWYFFSHLLPFYFHFVFHVKWAFLG